MKINAFRGPGIAPLAILAVAWCMFEPQQALGQTRSAAGTTDAFGYQVFDQNDSECAYQFVDIAGSGAPIVMTAASVQPARDDGGAAVALAASFDFYGRALTSLVMSSNGYLGAAASLSEEDGGDFSNDGALPAIPDNDPAIVARLMPFHEELSGEASGGATQSEYFAVCPRPSGAIVGEPCTVLQWSDWGFHALPGTFDFQVILYHSSFAIVLQVDLGALAHGAATVGIQDFTAGSGLQYVPPTALTGTTAVCFFEPRFSPDGLVADLWVTKNDKIDSLVGQPDVTYEIVARNSGPSPITGATVADTVTAQLLNCTWTCTPSTGSSCTAAGTGDIADTVDLPVGGWVAYSLFCDIDPGATGTVENTATVTVPPGVTDPEPANNTAGDSDPVPIELVSLTVN